MSTTSKVIIGSVAGLRVPHEVYVRELGAGFDVTFLEGLQPADRNRALDDANVVITLNPAKDFTRDEISKMSRLRFVQALTAGVDHIPGDLFPRHLPLGNTAGATASAIAEHALALVLAAAKRLVFEHN